jgi:hypothetical protein
MLAESTNRAASVPVAGRGLMTCVLIFLLILLGWSPEHGLHVIGTLLMFFAPLPPFLPWWDVLFFLIVPQKLLGQIVVTVFLILSVWLWSLDLEYPRRRVAMWFRDNEWYPFDGGLPDHPRQLHFEHTPQLRPIGRAERINSWRNEVDVKIEDRS